jgi:FtsP/CotA-like multicopper oxidase with cupredoxin domain
MDAKAGLRFNRRELLKYGGAALLGSAAAPLRASETMSSTCTFKADEKLLTEAPCATQKVQTEFIPTSPFILYPFTDPLVVPSPLAPLTAAQWTARGLTVPTRDAQSSLPGSTHSLWPSDVDTADDRPLPDPLMYLITVKDGTQRWTTSKVLPIDAAGNEVVHPVTKVKGATGLPESPIWGFNGQFPGPMINARYGRPVVVRFKNELRPKADPRDFGSPEGEFLVHLHNGHTAPESDGNPHDTPHGYERGQWVDNLYLNWPPHGDDNEKQSFLWFHDHFEAYTGANVYKGLVGLYPIYDEIRVEADSTRSFITHSGKASLDPGDENAAGSLRLPGVLSENTDRSFSVAYDIPLAIHDILLDDGVTSHHDFHGGCGEMRPDLWGQKFFKHYPNHGFVGDIFTVNGTAFPVLHVNERRYRFRFLDASIARVFNFVLMTSKAGPQEARGTQGQWLLPDGQPFGPFVQIASEGGLLPYPILRDSVELWPSRRKEVVLDFTGMTGKEIYLVNTMKMEDGRKPDSSDPSYKVPVLKIIVDKGPATDKSEPFFDADGNFKPRALRPLPDVDFSDAALSQLFHRSFELQRGGTPGDEFPDDPVAQDLAEEYEWLINSHPFQLCTPLASTVRDRPEVWRIKNGGGGWVHPMHFHQEEHRIFIKNGVRYDKVTPVGADDVFAKEDTISLGPGEEVVMYRNFRTFPAFPTIANRKIVPTAKYVAHCHNLAHEDHSMMFGWQIVDPATT